MKILYCDKSIIVCIKPAGVVSEEAPGGMPDLIRAELHDAVVFPVHRLDKGVGGVMVYALTKEAAASLTRQMTAGASCAGAGRNAGCVTADASSGTISDKSFEKEYLAVVEGIPEPASGRMEDLLFHSARENRTYVVKRMRKGVKEAVLEYEVLQTVRADEKAAAAEAPTGTPGTVSLVRVHLLTGRTHQIRAQFASRKLPLVGDRRYGAQTSGDIALWSHRLTFRHPVTGEELSFAADPPETGPWQLFTEPSGKE